MPAITHNTHDINCQSDIYDGKAYEASMYTFISCGVIVAKIYFYDLYVLEQHRKFLFVWGFSL